MIAGLKYLHGIESRNRDSKPENILSGFQADLKIGDFGISYRAARRFESTSRPGGTVLSATTKSWTCGLRTVSEGRRRGYDRCSAAPTGWKGSISGWAVPTVGRCTGSINASYLRDQPRSDCNRCTRRSKALVYDPVKRFSADGPLRNP